MLLEVLEIQLNKEKDKSMCAICGFIDFKLDSNQRTLNNMVKTLHHRGPDDFGTNIYDQKTAIVGFGHTRLSILDLSPLGHQPMEYDQYSMVYNGEIYNFSEIKDDLLGLGHQFKSESDTEVILHSFKEWGLDCISKFVGMFAFVICNKDTNKITIVRDRAGVKPLFYYWDGNLFLFSSELKAFHKHPRFIKKINTSAVYEFMDAGYISAPNCIFENCFKLEPGNIVDFDLNSQKIIISSYWDVEDYYKLPKLSTSYEEASEKIEELLVSAFNYRMISDVPVGVFLSGGYDSTAVTAILQKGRKDKLNTFTIGFEEGNNEAPAAKEIANFLGTNHTEYICTTKEAQKIISTLPFFFDEPFGDSSAIPTILVSKLAEKDVTVVLSADAGDEIFAGYNLYQNFENNLQLVNRIPFFLRKGVSVFLKLLNNFIPSSKQRLKKKIQIFSEVLYLNKSKATYRLFNSYYELSKDIKSKLFKKPVNLDINKLSYKVKVQDELSIALSEDYIGYLQNDILTKVDRSTMSVSIEGREPFLDHRIIEYVAQLPNNFKYNNGVQKRILKDIVHRYVPKELMDRPKSGFSLPLNSWLKNELNYLIEEHLSVESIEKSGFFNYDYIEELKNKLYDDTLYDSSIIWKLIQFQMWYKEWML